MARKKVGKQRLDKFYRLAKDHGYRARSAFKLIELNKKYRFLDNAEAVIDLCAAPGGWLQVCLKHMPSTGVLVGVDLDKIRALPCRTIVSDITTKDCFDQLKNIFVYADVVLHDGAPNVGTEWTQDAYVQNNLVLSAAKLASSFLRKNGVFVTKVFRSKDYSSLLWVFGMLFDNVEATKPVSSREESAEIFVVCRGFKKPDYIGEDLFDPNKVFGSKDIEEETISNFYKVMPFADFLLDLSLKKTLENYSKVNIDEEHKAWFGDEINALVADLKVINKYDIKKIERFRDKFVRSVLNDEIQSEHKAALQNLYEDEVIEQEKDDDEEWKFKLIEKDLKSSKRKKARELLREKARIAKDKGFDLPDDDFFEDKLFEAINDKGFDSDEPNDYEREERMQNIGNNNMINGKENMDNVMRSEGVCISADSKNDFYVKTNGVTDQKKYNKHKELDSYGGDVSDTESFELTKNEIEAIVEMKKDEDGFSLKSIDRNIREETNLPEWYIKDEIEHNSRILPEEKMVIEKKKIKKEIEAENRRRKKAKRIVTKMAKEHDDVGEKLADDYIDPKTMRKTYKRLRLKPLYVCPKKGKTIAPITKRRVKLVDARMKKELAANKRKLKTKKKR